MRSWMLLLTLIAVPLSAQPLEADLEIDFEIVMNCGRCGDEPASIWDLPSCTGEDMDDALRASALRGDRSAIALLQRRYDTAFTHVERYRIAEVLLNRVVDDRAIWREVESHAAKAVSFLTGTDEGKQRLAAYCAEKDYPCDEYERMLLNYFMVAGTDRRSRSLLRRALHSQDISLVAAAIGGLASQKDESSLTAIDKAIREWSHEDEKSQLALMLSGFRSEKADALALQFIEDAEGRGTYFEFRDSEM